MATLAKRAAVFLIVMASIGACFGANYKVGDSLGWTNETTVGYYQDWSSNKTFFVGDTFFFQYDDKLSDVMQVSRDDFLSCNPRAPLNIYESGRDNITIRMPGHFYYICSKEGRCKAGQKVEITVLTARTSTPTPSPSPSPAPSPSPSPSPFPSPSPIPGPSSSPTSSPSSTPASPHQPSTPSPSSIPAAPQGPSYLPTPSSSPATPDQPLTPAAATGSSQNSVSSLASSSGLLALQLLLALGLLAQ